MFAPLTDRQFRQVLAARVKRLRDQKGVTQAAMAHALGLHGKDAYVKYETRSAMPHRLIAQFAMIVGTTTDRILTHDLDRADLEVLEAAGMPVRRAS